MQRKVLFIDASHPILPKKLEELGFDCEYKLKASRKEILDVLPAYYGVVIRSRLKVDHEFIDCSHSLKFIARYGVGLEHIDLAYAAKSNVQVFASPEGSRNAVGEHTIGLLLMLMNHLGRAAQQVKEGIWLREQNRGTEIKGKTVGILGYGNMGQAFAKRLSGFDAKVIAFDKFKSNYGNQFAKAVSLEVLQRESDILSIHIPYTEHNHYFINHQFLSAFQKPIYLVNTARGLVLKTEDLVDHLKSQKVLGAALDVIEYEEGAFVQLDPGGLPEAFQYLRMANNVILNPHIAGWSHEAKQGHAFWLGKKIETWLASTK